jgi:hypothetical protein
VSAIEAALRATAAGEAAPGVLLAAVRDGELLVPVTAEGELPVLEHGGRRFVPAFTSAEHLAAARPPGTAGAVARSGAQLAADWPAGVGLALNPGAALGVGRPEAEVRALAGAPGERLQVGAPATEPPGLRAALTAWVAGRDDVRAVHVALVRRGDAEPELVLGLEPARAQGARAAAAAPADAFSGAPVVLVEDRAPDPVARWMRDRAQPLVVA